MTKPDHTPTPTSDALKPCPFCGGSATCWSASSADFAAQVCCDECHVGTDSFETREEAIAAWNRRAAEPVGEIPADIIKQIDFAKELMAQTGVTVDEFLALLRNSRDKFRAQPEPQQQGGEGKQTLPAGTVLHFRGCPLTLASDAVVIVGTDLREWQDQTNERRSDGH